MQARRDYAVNWRFISLPLIDSHIDCDAHFPPEYEAGHTAGLRLLRMTPRAGRARPRSDGRVVRRFGAHIFDAPADPDDRRSAGETRQRRGTREFADPILADAGLPLELAGALDDGSCDAEIRRETDEALARTDKDVGTPIVQFEPPSGAAFFGPVMSRLPNDDSALELWDRVVGLARLPGFAELKRSLREKPQSAALGVDPATVGQQEDWHAGSRRQKK